MFLKSGCIGVSKTWKALKLKEAWNRWGGGEGIKICCFGSGEMAELFSRCWIQRRGFVGWSCLNLPCFELLCLSLGSHLPGQSHAGSPEGDAEKVWGGTKAQATVICSVRSVLALHAGGCCSWAWERQNVISCSLGNVVINEEWAHKLKKKPHPKSALPFYKHTLITHKYTSCLPEGCVFQDVIPDGSF